jgi:hypothetical protein
MVTVDAALEHLESVGLIAVRPAVGSLSGNEYEIFTPDEAYTSISSRTSIPSSTRITQKVDELDVLESGSTSITQCIENAGGYGPPNTSFKTKDINTDDEAFAKFAAAVRKTAKEITGKEPSKAEAARWAEVAEVLMTELRIAADCGRKRSARSRPRPPSRRPPRLPERLTRRNARTASAPACTTRKGLRKGWRGARIQSSSSKASSEVSQGFTGREKLCLKKLDKQERAHSALPNDMSCNAPFTT